MDSSGQHSSGLRISDFGFSWISSDCIILFNGRQIWRSGGFFWKDGRLYFTLVTLYLMTGVSTVWSSSNDDFPWWHGGALHKWRRYVACMVQVVPKLKKKIKRRTCETDETKSFILNRIGYTFCDTYLLNDMTPERTNNTFFLKSASVPPRTYGRPFTYG